MFCDGDLNPDTKPAAYTGRGIQPPNFVKIEMCAFFIFELCALQFCLG
jgi:hypothetical protein